MELQKITPETREQMFSEAYDGSYYTASCVGGECKNCINDNGHLRIICDNHGLLPGKVKIAFYANRDNDLYPDGKQLTVTPIDGEIELVTGVGTADADDATITAMLPIVTVSAYQLAVIAGYQGSQDEFNAYLATLPQAVEDANNATIRADDAVSRAEDAIGRCDTAVGAVEVAITNANAAAEAANTAAQNASQGGGTSGGGTPSQAEDETTRDLERIDLLRGTDENYVFLLTEGTVWNGVALKRDTWVRSNSAPGNKEYSSGVSKIAKIGGNWSSYLVGKTSIRDLYVFDGLRPGHLIGFMYGCVNIKDAIFSDGFLDNTTSMQSCFQKCSNLEVVDINQASPHLTNLSNAFNGCNKLRDVRLRNLTIDKVTTLAGMFAGCSSLESLDLSGDGWYTGALTTYSDTFVWCDNLRFITLGSGLFATTLAQPFHGAPNLGLNADGTSNGWLEHLAGVAPSITTKSALNLPDDAPLLVEDENEHMALTDGIARTIQLHANLKNKPWAEPLLATLAAKGYTIA